MILASGKGHYSGQPCWWCGLAEVIVTPSEDCPVGFQDQTVPAARGDGGHAGQARRWCCLTLVVQPPADNGCRAERRRSHPGHVGKGRRTICTVSAYSIIIPCAGPNPGVAINRRVRQHLSDLGEVRIIKRSLDLKSVLIAGVVYPRQIDLMVGECCSRQIRGRGWWRGDSRRGLVAVR